VDRVSTGGTILVQASCDLLGYAGSAGGTAQRIPDQLLDWLRAESRVRPADTPRRTAAAAPSRRCSAAGWPRSTAVLRRTTGR